MQVGWIDFSAEERSRTLTVLSSLSEPGSVDELGIGIVRDAMADVLFPATSTLLTKARYFFLVPYLSRLLEEGHDDQRQDPRVMRNRYRDLERKCAEGMLKCEKSTEGIVGRVALARGKWVTRGPGEIYWASIRTLGFMKDGAPDSYFGQFPYLSDARLRDRRGQYVGGKGESDDGLSDDLLAYGSMWKMPRDCYGEWKDAWTHWDDRASIRLTSKEARYLKRQVVERKPDSLYALLLTDEPLRDIALATLYGDADGATGLGDSSFHVFLSHALARINSLSPEVAAACALADAFSELVLGCRIAYNMQIAGQEDQGQQEWDDFTDRAAGVAQRVDLAATGAALGLTGHVGFQVMAAFLERAKAAMIAGDIDALKDEVRKREVAIKGSRYKIGRTDMGDYGWRGGRRLPYRFNNAMGIIREIQEAGGCDA